MLHAVHLLVLLHAATRPHGAAPVTLHQCAASCADRLETREEQGVCGVPAEGLDVMQHPAKV